MTISFVGAALSLLAMVGGGIALDRIALGMIRPSLKPVRLKTSDLPFPVSELTITSGDQALSGWILAPKTDQGGPVLVLVHGWGSNHGTVARLARPLLAKGHPVVLFDIRHHGESRGAPYVTARHFRDDILATVRETQSCFPGRPVVLIGHSMGGSMGVLAVAEGAPVQGLVSVGAPADLWEVWAYHLEERGIPGRWAVIVLRPFWKLRAGVPWPSLDPRLRAGEIHVPFLVLHGEDDESVPAGHARILADAAGVVATVLPGEGHTDILESPELLRAVEGFLKTI